MINTKEITRFVDNAREVYECEWFLKMCETAIVENDIAFIKAFNSRLDKFKKLFIE